MDLPSIQAVATPTNRAALPAWSAGAAFLAGGTWLFSEPQPQLHALIDLHALGWPPLAQDGDRFRIAATCTIAELEAFKAPPAWLAAPLFASCGRALAGSFKVRHAATVGGNICLALPAAPMLALAVGLGGTAWIWHADGSDSRRPMAEFATGPQRTVLAAGDVLRAVELPVITLQRRSAMRQISLTSLGRSGALLVATVASARHAFTLTITASTARPIVLHWALPPKPAELDDHIAALPDTLWLEDAHGTRGWRRQVTRVLASELLAELAP